MWYWTATQQEYVYGRIRIDREVVQSISMTWFLRICKTFNAILIPIYIYTYTFWCRIHQKGKYWFAGIFHRIPIWYADVPPESNNNYSALLLALRHAFNLRKSAVPPPLSLQWLGRTAVEVQLLQLFSLTHICMNPICLCSCLSWDQQQPSLLGAQSSIEKTLSPKNRSATILLRLCYHSCSWDSVSLPWTLLALGQN